MRSNWIWSWYINYDEIYSRVLEENHQKQKLINLYFNRWHLWMTTLRPSIRQNMIFWNRPSRIDINQAGFLTNDKNFDVIRQSRWKFELKRNWTISGWVKPKCDACLLLVKSKNIKNDLGGLLDLFNSHCQYKLSRTFYWNKDVHHRWLKWGYQQLGEHYDECKFAQDRNFDSGKGSASCFPGKLRLHSNK